MIRIERILCPVDFSEPSVHALEYAVELGRQWNAEVELLHVLQPVVYGVGSSGTFTALEAQVWNEVTQAADQQLKDLAEKVRQRHARTESHLATGVPFVEIVQRARAREVDLIVMGTHGRTGVAHALIGSCAERVVRKAPCPVLTVKHPEHDFVMP